MPVRDAASAINPVEPYELDPPVSLRDALDDFAPERPSAPVARTDLRPGDQLVRDIRARTPATAPTPGRTPALLARTVAFLRQNGSLVVVIGGVVTGGLLGTRAATFVVDGPTVMPAPLLPPSLNLPTDAGDIVLFEAPEPLPPGTIFGSQEGMKLVQPPPGPRRPARQAGSLVTGAGRFLTLQGSGRAAATTLGFGAAGTGTAAQRSAPTAVVPATPAAAARQDEAVEAPVYSSEDRDVRPPQLRSAELSSPLMPGAPTRTASMEVVVSEQGTVERARFLTPPRRMPDMMMLSRAKVWEFTPALKEGRPVRYRLVLSWEVSQ